MLSPDMENPAIKIATRKEMIAFAEASRRKAIGKVEADYLAFVSSLDRLAPVGEEHPQSVTSGTKVPEISATGSVQTEKPKRAYKKRHAATGPAGLVREAIATMEEFSTITLYGAIQNRHPGARIEKVNISGILNKMLKSGEIARTFNGKLKEPHRYQKSEGKALF